jgi:arylsulfatase A-like enzyme
MHYRFIATLVCYLLTSLITSAQDAPPNIVLIMADDHGRWATSVYGDKRIRTPNLDYLAKNGVVFNAASSPAPVCSPARASFFTGKLPSQHGVHDFLSEDSPYDQNTYLVGETLLSEKLQSVGYAVGLFGKWHASEKSHLPKRGFDQWISYDQRETNWMNQYLHAGEVHFSINGKAVRKTETQAWYLTEQALAFVDTLQTQPFFLCMTYVEPHFPFADLPERTVDTYRSFAQEIVPYGDTSWPGRSTSNEENVPEHEEWVAQYLAAVTLLDEQIGRMLDGLQARDMLENTIFIYTSDHGHMTGQYGLYGKANASRPHNLTEETLNIPLIISGPKGLIRPGQVRSEFVNLCDLHETIVDYANFSYDRPTPPPQGPGKSLIQILSGQRIPDWREYQFAEYGNARSVSNGHWKLIRYYAQSRSDPPVDQWFDLSNPRGERAPSAQPSEATQAIFVAELESFFAQYETEAHSGKTVWNQGPFNSMEPWKRLPQP